MGNKVKYVNKFCNFSVKMEKKMLVNKNYGNLFKLLLKNNKLNLEY
jgi:hypothetical protein